MKTRTGFASGARYDDERLTGGRDIFCLSPEKAGASHPGGRILFLPDKTFLLTVCDGYEYKEATQDLGSHLGKILRLDRDGRTPADNPFTDREGARPEIWSYGHRYVQGLAVDPETGFCGRMSTVRAPATRSTGSKPAQITAGR